MSIYQTLTDRRLSSRWKRGEDPPPPAQSKWGVSTGSVQSRPKQSHAVCYRIGHKIMSMPTFPQDNSLISFACASPMATPPLHLWNTALTSPLSESHCGMSGCLSESEAQIEEGFIDTSSLYWKQMLSLSSSFVVWPISTHKSTFTSSCPSFILQPPLEAPYLHLSFLSPSFSSPGTADLMKAPVVNITVICNRSLWLHSQPVEYDPCFLHICVQAEISVLIYFSLFDHRLITNLLNLIPKSELPLTGQILRNRSCGSIL